MQIDVTYAIIQLISFCHICITRDVAKVFGEIQISAALPSHKPIKTGSGCVRLRLFLMITSYLLVITSLFSKSLYTSFWLIHNKILLKMVIKFIYSVCRISFLFWKSGYWLIFSSSTICVIFKNNYVNG